MLPLSAARPDGVHLTLSHLLFHRIATDYSQGKIIAAFGSLVRGTMFFIVSVRANTRLTD